MSGSANADSVDSCKEMCITLQCMIEISAENLEGLRTQCLTSAVLTQQEIRRIEGKLIKLFGGQLLARSRIPADQLLASGCAQYPSLQLWLRVVGLSSRSANCVGERCASLQWLLGLSETQLVTFLQPLLAEPAELHRLVRAVNNLNKYIELETEGSGGSNPELLLFWDSWQSATTANPNFSSSTTVSSPALNRRRCTSSSSDKAGSWQPVSTAAAGSSPADLRRASSPVQIHGLTADQTQVSVCDPAAPTGGAIYNGRQTRVCPSPASVEDTSVGTCAVHQRHASFTPVSSYHLVASPDQQLQLDSAAELSASPDDSGGDGAAGRSGGSSSYSPVVPHAPRSPRTPTFPGSMSHVINHVFVKTFNVSTCDYCKKQMIYGLRCRECRYKCHRHCEQLVPPSCGLPRKFVDFFIDQVQSQGNSSPNLVDGRLARFSGGRRRSHRSALSGSLHTFGDSSSTTSSCTSTAPSSPAFPQVGTPSPAAVVVPDRFHFPEVSPSTAARMSVPSGADPLDFSSALYSGTPRSQRPLQRLPAVDAVGTDGSTSTLMSGSSTVTTDSEHTLPCRMDSQDSTNSEQDTMSRQDSLSLREWDIPFEEVRLDEVIGRGRFGQVHRGHWHGEVAVKLLPMEDDAALDRFKQDVATFRKTRHDNLVLFMGACVCPPRLAIITSYCRGKTLYALLHGLKEKFNLTKISNIARHISLGMGYLHARGIVHKDLKTKNIFVDNAGTVVITDFGLSSLTRPCRSTAWDQLQVPRGWLCYLSPEIIRCLRTEDNSTLPFSTASDVYAFGTVWYELLSGEWPWRSQPAESVIWLVGQGMKQSLANIQASRDVKDVLLRCWNFHQQDRLDFVGILSILGKLPKKRLTRSPSHPIQLSRSVESVF